ncbi:hypothetical protein BDQ17DRAFT_1332442 [Cyathus striatus]|nr:hypothetical protein BDQ17DRAFT_1332442 [Cyathus striatus]
MRRGAGCRGVVVATQGRKDEEGSWVSWDRRRDAGEEGWGGMGEVSSTRRGGGGMRWGMGEVSSTRRWERRDEETWVWWRRRVVSRRRGEGDVARTPFWRGVVVVAATQRGRRGTLGDLASSSSLSRRRGGGAPGAWRRRGGGRWVTWRRRRCRDAEREVPGDQGGGAGEQGGRGAGLHSVVAFTKQRGMGREGWNIGQECWAHTPAAAASPVLLLIVVLRAPLAMRLPLPFLPCTTLVVPPVQLFLRPSGAVLVLILVLVEGVGVGVGVCAGAMVVVMGVAGWSSLSLSALGAVIGDVVAGVGGRVDGGVDVAVSVVVGVGAVRH